MDTSPFNKYCFEIDTSPFNKYCFEMLKAPLFITEMLEPNFNTSYKIKQKWEFQYLDLS